MKSLIIIGDLCPIGRNLNYFVKGEVDKIIDEKILEELHFADYVLANLECPLLGQKTASNDKVVSAHGVSSKVIKGILQLGINGVNLANNHTLDFGEAGLNDSIEIAETNSIKVFGVKSSNGQFYSTIDLNNLKIGVLSVVDSEALKIEEEVFLSISSLELLDHVRAVVRASDYRIVLVHAGISGYPWPSPQFLKFSHFLVDNGINLVIFQHNHIPGIHEIYKGQHIIYGQGNFLFDIGDSEEHFPYWHRGNLLKILFDESTHSLAKIEFIPYIQSFKKPGISLVTSVEEDEFFRLANTQVFHSLKIQDIKRNWEELVRKRIDDILFNLIIGSNSRIKEYISVYIHRKIPLLRKFISPYKASVLRNYLISESNREILIESSKQLFKEK